MSLTQLTSIIITTYNWPEALRLVLLSLNQQSENQFEVIIADDGSREDTRKMIEQLSDELNYPFKHVWQEDIGFRAARSRNKAVLASEGEYLIFLDGDCIVRHDFIAQHRDLSLANRFIRGNRVKLNQNFTSQLLKQSSIKPLGNVLDLFKHRLKGELKRIFPLLRLPLGAIRNLQQKNWKGVKTCNLSLSRADFIAVNGFNESFEGWGHEDADLAIRLIRNNVYRTEGTFATTVFHCHHHEQDRFNEEKNRQMLEQSFNGDIRPQNGLYDQT
mgnify:CR=1 FL=1